MKRSTVGWAPTPIVGASVSAITWRKKGSLLSADVVPVQSFDKLWFIDRVVDEDSSEEIGFKKI